MHDDDRDGREGLVEKQGWLLDHGSFSRERLQDLNPTTRCYPRSLADAFPDSIERAEWFYPPDKQWSGWDYVLCGVGAFLWIQLAYYMVS